jgi:hypothetical protein
MHQNLRKHALKCMFIIYLFLTGCATTWSHQSGNNSNLNTDSRYCGATANSVAPTYICRNPLMCAPDELGIALERIAQNNAAYDRCMIQKGYTAQ